MKKKNRPLDNLAEKYFDVAEVMLVVINADQTVNRINQKGCNLLGYEEKEIVGKNWFDIFLPEELRIDVKSVYNKLIKGEIEPVEYYENPVLTKNGEKKLIAWHNTIMKDEKGEIVYTISSGEDITERRHIESEILSISNIPAENPNPVIRISSQKKILYTNDSFNELLTDAGFLENDAFNILPDDLYALIDNALKSGKPHIMIEARAADRIISYNIVPIMEHAYVNLYGRDITDHKMAENEVQKKVEDLERFYDMAVGRELKMKELKKEVNVLKARISIHENN
jgi:PAS domain S-box-containing protein